MGKGNSKKASAREAAVTDPNFEDIVVQEDSNAIEVTHEEAKVEESNLKTKKNSDKETNDAVILEFSRIQIHKKRLGKGGMGVVHSGLLDEKHAVAIKKLDVQNRSQLEEIMAEARMLAKLDHKYVVRMFGVAQSSDSSNAASDQHNRGESLSVPSKGRQSMFIVMELCDSSLSKLLDDPRQDVDFDNHALQIALQVAETMAFLHDQNVSHRDLKPGNILLREGDVRLADFGLSKNLKEGNSNTLEIGTPAYMAPELFVEPSLESEESGTSPGKQKVDSRKSDVYAFAIILWALFHRQHPYTNFNTFKIIFKVKMEGIRPKIDETAHENVADLLKACWHDDQLNRPDFHKIFASLAAIKQVGSWFKRGK